MTPAARPDLGDKRRRGGAVISLVAQGTFSANSLVLTAMAAWLLPTADFGRFGVVFGTLALVGSVQDALVGEARAVFDTRSREMRATLSWGVALVAAAAAAACAVTATTAGAGSGAVLAAAAAGAGWALATGLRRVLSAEMEYAALAANDVTFLIGALAALGALGWGGEVTLAHVLAAWAVGSMVSWSVGLAQAPAGSFVMGWWDRAAVGLVAGFGSWRVAQASLRPLALLALRLVVATVESPAAVAQLELARIVVAPITSASAGLSQYLLPNMARHPERAGALMRRWELRLTAAGVAYGVLAVGGAWALSGRLGSFDTELEPVSVAAWALLGVAMAVGLPSMARLVAAGRPRPVFTVRLVDNVVGLVGVVVLAAVGLGEVTPAALGASGILASGWLRQLAGRGTPTEEDDGGA